MENKSETAEKLLGAWLKLSAAIRNERIVTGMTFNEAYICNLLLKRKAEESSPPLTATELCNETGLLKSHMNKTLIAMEKKGYITRARSNDDKRAVYINIPDNGALAYTKSHEITLNIMRDLVEKLGEEKSLFTAEALEEIALDMKKILGGDSNEY